jgi:hypothetical protein
MHGAFHREELVCKAGAGFANGHVQAQLCCFFQAQIAVLHRHHHRGDFFTTATKGVIHDKYFKQPVGQTN